MKRLSLLSLGLMPALLSALTITEVVQDTILTHPQMQIQKESLKAKQESLVQSKAGYMPSIDLSLSVGPEVTKTPANNRERAQMTRSEISATLTQNIFAGLDTKYAIQEQESLILAAGDSVTQSANNLALQASTAYLDVLKTLALYNIAKENVEVHDKYLKQIKEKVDAGIVRNSDYEQTLSRYEGARSAEYLTQQNHFIAVYNLQRILPNVTPDELEEPTVGVLPADSAEALVELALANNPILSVSKNDIEAAKSAVNRSDAPYYPTADIVLNAYKNENVHGLGYDSATNKYTNESKDDGYSGMLVINYNIFNGLADSANKQINQHLLLKENSSLADTKLFVEANTKISFVTYEMTTKQLVYIERNIESSAQTVSDYQQEHELGRRSIIDLLNIELEYNNARNKKVNAKYSNLTSYYEILSHTGKMLEVMNVTVK